MIRGLRFTTKDKGPGRGWWGPPKGTHSGGRGVVLMEFKPFRKDPTAKLNPAEMTREEFKYRWLQSAQTEHGVSISSLSEREREHWVGHTGEVVIRVYRGAQKDRRFEPGDFVTTSVEYAKTYGGKVVAMDVPVSLLRYMRGSIHGDPRSCGDNTPPELIFVPIKTGFHTRYHSYDWEKFQ